MTGSDPSRSSDHRRFLVEALVLGLIALAWAGSLAFLRSHAGQKSLMGERSIDLLDMARAPAIRYPEMLFVPLSDEPESRLAFRALEPLPGETTFAVVVRARRGGVFVLSGYDPGSDQRFRFHFPLRREQEEFLRFFRLERPAEGLRLRLDRPQPQPLSLLEMSLREFPASYGRTLTLLELSILPVLLVFGIRWGRYLAAALRSPTPLTDRFFAAAVFLVCLFAFHRAPVSQIIDSKYLSAVSHATLHTGRVALPEDFWPSRWTEGVYQLREVDGRVFHYFPAAPAILNVPVVAAYELFGISPVSEEGRFRRQAEGRILRFAAALVAAALCLVLYRLGRLHLSPGPTLVLVASFAFGSQIFSTISRPFWSHAWATLLLASGLYLLLRPSRRPRISRVAAATILSWAFFCRPTMSLSILALVALLAWRRASHRWLFVATGALWAAAFAARNLVLFGELLPTYFSQTNYQSGRPTEAILGNYPHALLGNLFSPGRGLLIFVPMVLWILWALYRDRRRLESRDLVIVALLVVTAHWQLISLFGNWTAGKSFGPRLFSDVVVWLFLLAVIALRSTLELLERHGVATMAPRLAALALAVAASLFVNTRGAWVKETWNWRSFDRPPAWAVEGGRPRLRPPGIWNWRYPQFMAGLLPKDAVEEGGDEPLTPRSREP